MFNRKRFFDGFRSFFGRLTDSQVKALEWLLSAIEADPHVSDLRHTAYMLATTYHETAYTFLPVHEYGSRAYFIKRYGGHTALGKRLGNDTPEEGAIYAGRGDVQLTGEDNYERAEDDLRRDYPVLVADFERRTGRKFDLTVGDQPGDLSDPDNATDPQIAYAIMSNGMRKGRFTGRKLSDYIQGDRCDYREARRIINGLDKADRIAELARKFETILRGAKQS